MQQEDAEKEGEDDVQGDADGVSGGQLNSGERNITENRTGYKTDYPGPNQWVIDIADDIFAYVPKGVKFEFSNDICPPPYNKKREAIQEGGNENKPPSQNKFPEHRLIIDYD